MFNNVFVALGALGSLVAVGSVIWLAAELNQEYKQRFVKIDQRLGELDQRLGELPVSADPSISRRSQD